MSPILLFCVAGLPAALCALGWARTARTLAAFRAENAQLRIDPVTELLTRRPWTERARELLPQLDDPVVTMCDLNGFKRVNEQFTHADGDTVLDLFACCLRGAFGPRALIGRFGGDEFVVLIDRQHLDGDLHTAAAACLVHWRGVYCGAAFGAARPLDLALRDGATDADLPRAERRARAQLGRMLHAADLASQRAKARCRRENLLTATAWFGAADPAVPEVLDPRPLARCRDNPVDPTPSGEHADLPFVEPSG